MEMEAETKNEQNFADDPRHQLRVLFAALTDHTPSDTELDNLAANWPLVTCLLSAYPMTCVDPFLRALPDELFDHLVALSRDFLMWSSPQDVDTWPQEFYSLTYLLATHERRRSATDDETIQAGRVFADVIETEHALRAGNVSYVMQYSLTCRPLAIRAQPPETGH